MAWSAPPAFVVSEIVTAARMNILSDNLNYLKGTGGAAYVTLDSSLVIGGLSGTPTSGNVTGMLQISGANAGAVLWRRSLGSYPGSPARGDNWTIYNPDGSFRWYDTADRMVLGTNGGLGVGVVPQGPLHVVGVGGGFVFLSVTGLNATLQTISGNLVTRGTGMFIGDISTSGGTDWSYGKILSPQLNSFEDYTTADGDVIRVSVTAGGAITVQRQSGTFTHQINILCCYY